MQPKTIQSLIDEREKAIDALRQHAVTCNELLKQIQAMQLEILALSGKL